jgi:16S rRNA (cytosine1402-N4)-methyltransferase
MHESVLPAEVISNLNIKKDLIYVDCTLGYAGHSREILKRINKGFLFAFDQDIDAVKYSKKTLEAIANNFEIINSNFISLKSELKKRNIEKVDGILFDLGVSSPQLDNPERGFSYHHNARLDMRMGLNNEFSAYEVVNEYSYEDLVNIFFSYGEEKYARAIAMKIISKRNEKPITTTLELVEIIKESVPEKYKRETHPARRIFQAIRIEVNQELKVLEQALEDAIELLNKDGRICVITFHSLEDKICKRILKKYSDIDPKLKKLPSVPDEYQPKLRIIGKFKPSKEEINVNNRARSATLRVAEKL